MTGFRHRSAVFGVAGVAIAGVFVAPPAGAEDLDMKKIFRCTAAGADGQAACDRARDLVVFNCTVCHLFVRIVLKQGAPEEWNGVLARHRTRVAQLSDDQFQAIRSYLTATFRPDLPPPELPEYLAIQY